MIFKAWMLSLAIVAHPTLVGAGEDPVVVELYTSQGCSSCPPADKLLSKLAEHADVLPLALHVDYWDYIGWKDEFADPAFTRRQKGYARAAEQRTIYTPQMVVNGVDHVVGHQPMQVMDLIQKHKARPDVIDLDVTRTGDTLTIVAHAKDDSIGPMIVQLVQISPSETVSIHRGENAGRRITYTNIVTDWKALGEWSGSPPLRIEADLSGPGAVILQRPNHGPIVAAARVD